MASAEFFDRSIVKFCPIMHLLAKNLTVDSKNQPKTTSSKMAIPVWLFFQKAVQTLLSELRGILVISSLTFFDVL
jgi:hypothetical protein